MDKNEAVLSTSSTMELSIAADDHRMGIAARKIACVFPRNGNQIRCLVFVFQCGRSIWYWFCFWSVKFAEGNRQFVNENSTNANRSVAGFTPQAQKG